VVTPGATEALTQLLIEVEAERMAGRAEEYPYMLLGLIPGDACAQRDRIGNGSI
jgi:hypothetical protein